MLLTICDPPVKLRVLPFRKMLPALPDPDVATDIVPSAIVNVGADRLICPAFPAPTNN